MSHLQYFSYPGTGERNRKNYSYSQAVRVGDQIHCSGQGGWNPEDGVIDKDINNEVEQAFKNVELALKDAGGKGWSQVYKVTSYHTSLNDEVVNLMVSHVRRWMPDHQPVWTVIGVTALGRQDMNVEVEVSAHLG